LFLFKKLINPISQVPTKSQASLIPDYEFIEIGKPECSTKNRGKTRKEICPDCLKKFNKKRPIR